ncbi:TPA: hypothetical protein ACP32N_003148 [Pseudomonas aeruginosa]
MTEFKFAVSKVLRQAHQEYQAQGEISENLRDQIARAMRNAEADNTVLSPSNVKRCIGIQHWLSEAVQHTNDDRRGFLESMQSKLHRFWFLTSGQVAAINAWGEVIRRRNDDFPHLDEGAFTGVVLPEFMRQKSSSGQ